MKKKADLGKFLKELDKEDLIEEIQKLYDRFDAVKTYYQIDLTGDTAPYLDAAKKKITGIFYLKGNKPRKPKASRLNKVIKDFEQLSIYKDDVIELLLYRVEETISFIRIHRYNNDQLQQSTLKAFQKVCALIRDNNLESKYKSRCLDICEKAAGIGLGNECRAMYDLCFG